MLLFSILIHFVGLLLLSIFYIAGNTGKAVYLTEVTILAEMPYGKGLGQKGELVDSSGKKTGTISTKKEGEKEKGKKPVVKTTKVSPRTGDDILKIRKETPIGIEESLIKTSGGIEEGPAVGGGFGEDNEKP